MTASQQQQSSYPNPNNSYTNQCHQQQLNFQWYDGPLFAHLASRFNNWEARQEYPPGAYLHLSLPNWGDQNLNGIHLETYILSPQLASGFAPVALHCECGCPCSQGKFLKLITERIKPVIDQWNQESESQQTQGNQYIIKAPYSDCVLETLVPLGATPIETIARLENELRRFITLAPLIDQTIGECQ